MGLETTLPTSSQRMLMPFLPGHTVSRESGDGSLEAMGASRRHLVHL